MARHQSDQKLKKLHWLTGVGEARKVRIRSTNTTTPPSKPHERDDWLRQKKSWLGLSLDPPLPLSLSEPRWLGPGPTSRVVTVWVSTLGSVLRSATALVFPGLGHRFGLSLRRFGSLKLVVVSLVGAAVDVVVYHHVCDKLHGLMTTLKRNCITLKKLNKCVSCTSEFCTKVIMNGW